MRHVIPPLALVASASVWILIALASEIEVGSVVRVTNTQATGLRLRAEPGVGTRVLLTLSEGTRLHVVAGPVQRDGYTWWRVTDNDRVGWAADRWLQAESPSHRSEPKAAAESSPPIASSSLDVRFGKDDWTAVERERPDLLRVLVGLQSCAELRRMLGDKEGLSVLLDPVFRNDDELHKAQRSWELAYFCLSRVGENPEGVTALQRLVERFLIFVGDPGQSLLAVSDSSGDLLAAMRGRRDVVDLNSTENPAVRQFRGHTKLNPEDSRVYVRYYTSRSDLPRVLRDAFKPEVWGITIGCRYVAVLSPEGFANKLVAAEDIILGHELLHVSVNVSAGCDRLDRFPVWFDEGVAAYYSLRGGRSIGSFRYRAAVEELHEGYSGYVKVFECLEAKLGDTLAGNVIALTIKAGRVEALLRSVREQKCGETLIRESIRGVVETPPGSPSPSQTGRGPSLLVLGIVIALILVVTMVFVAMSES